MADETPINVNTEASQKQIGDFNDALQEMQKGADAVSRKTAQSLGRIHGEMSKVTLTTTKMRKQFTPLIKEFSEFNELTTEASVSIAKLNRIQNQAMLQGNKQMLIATSRVKGLMVEYKDATRDARAAAASIDTLREAFISQTKAMDQSNEVMAETNKALTDVRQRMSDLYNSTTAAGRVNDDYKNKMNALKGELIEVKKASQLFQGEQDDLRNTMNSTAQQIEVATDELERHQTSMISLRENTLQTIESTWKMNREVRKLKGGFSGVTAAAEDLMAGRVMEYLGKFGTIAAVTGGLLMMDKAITQIAGHLESVQKVELTLGETGGSTGIGGFIKSAWDAEGAVSQLKVASSRLGIGLEELSEASNKVRVGIRFDKNGKLSEDAIMNLTEEAARFGKVAGIETADAVEMLDHKIKRMGMTNEQAVASLKGTRVILGQMMQGAKGTGIAMDDMVKLIEDASAASNAYVVDTRLLAQALRGAATQAANLGASQQQAKDVAEGVAKVFSDAPDYIKIPAGYDLLSQLTGGDSEQFLTKFDEGSRKQMEAIRDQIKAGTMDNYTAARAIMDISAGQEAGMDAMFNRLKKTVLESGNAASILAEEYGIKNWAVATQITKTLKDAAVFQDRMVASGGKADVSFIAGMTSQLIDFEGEVQAAKDSGKTLDSVLSAKGFDEDAIKQYKDAGAAQVKYEKQIQDLRASGASASDIAKVENELFSKATLVQTQLLDQALNPAKKILADLNKSGGTYTLNQKLNADDLRKANINSIQDFAKATGQSTSDAAAKYKAIFEGGEKITAKEIQGIKDANSQMLEDQNKKLQDTYSKFKDGFFAGTGAWLNDVFGVNFGPMTGALLGATAAIGGLYMLWKGAPAMLNTAIRGMAEPVRIGVQAAMEKSGPISNQKDLPPGRDNDGDGNSKKPRKSWKERWGGAKGKVGGLFRRGAVASTALATVTDAAAGAAPAAAKVSKFAGLGAKLTGLGGSAMKIGKGALTAGRAIPLLGTVIGGGMAISQAWDMWQKVQAGEKISPSDKVKMVAALGSMVPGIGTYVSLMDTAADMSGGYEKLDSSMGYDPSKTTNTSNTAMIARTLTTGSKMGMLGTVAGLGAAGLGGAAVGAGAYGGAASTAATMLASGGGAGVMNMMASAGATSLSSNGTVTLTIQNFGDLMVEYERQKAFAKATGSKS